jgi:hypothetical protein
MDDAVWRVNGKQKWRTFHRQKDADRFLANAVKATRDGTYRDGAMRSRRC